MHQLTTIQLCNKYTKSFSRIQTGLILEPVETNLASAAHIRLNWNRDFMKVYRKRGSNLLVHLPKKATEKLLYL
jgi:hypothetical protein